MQIVEVIPVVKGLTKPTLTYFTKEKFVSGSFVRAPIRGKNTMGIVQRSTDAQKAKAIIKDANFVLKKISVIARAGEISDSFMKASEKTAKFYATTIGNVLKALMPKIYLEHPELIGKRKKIKTNGNKEVKVIQLGKEDRFREYRSIVRESFAQSTSVLFIVPTKNDAVEVFETLSMGIEKYVFTTAGKTPKTLMSTLTVARDMKHPILFITTPTFVSFDRSDLNTIILEKENSRQYSTWERPHLRIKTFLEFYAKERGALLVLGDSVLSLQSLWQEREGHYAEFTPMTWRLKQNSSTEIIDMRIKKEFEIFSPRLESILRNSVAVNKKVFVFGVRKGLSSTTICGDCASLLLCSNCKAPMVLHDGKASQPIYVCHHCNAKRSSETRCDNCGSWKLNPLGIGVDRIAKKIKEILPHVNILILDKDHAETAAKANAVVKKFETEDNTILIGTEMALQYVRGAHVVVAASIDSLFSIPDFYINERIFYLITKLRELAQENFLIQTRNAGTEVLEHAAAGNILDFYRNEIKEREELMYPPYSIFIKVSCEDKTDNIQGKAVKLQSEFGGFEPHFMLESNKKTGKDSLSMILRLPTNEWPQETLREKLLLLTPDFLIKVDPESIL
ncbi:MAG: hypothetical protein ACYCY6_01900 [Minisyncoccota bacterium]